jgi:hypothetical protein
MQNVSPGSAENMIFIQQKYYIHKNLFDSEIVLAHYEITGGI